MDYNKINKAVKLFLEGIGEDLNREGLVETPDRVIKMCKEIFAGIGKTADEYLSKQFLIDNNDIIIVKDIAFHSICEHHLLPFMGKVHVAYIPNNKIVGLSKIARTVEVYACRLQIQENLTNEIASAIDKCLNPQGVMVMVEAKHICMTMRGIKKNESLTITYAKRGCFINNVENQKIFIEMIKK